MLNGDCPDIAYLRPCGMIPKKAAPTAIRGWKLAFRKDRASSKSAAMDSI